VVDLPQSEIVARNAEWELELRFDLVAPSGTLTQRAQTYPMLDAHLLLVHANRLAAAQFDADYRLSFEIDICLHALPAPNPRWDACYYAKGSERPVVRKRYEMLVHRRGVPGGSSGLVEIVDVACVPSSGLGPSCSMCGTTSPYGSCTPQVP
jgi:hypothetical protein